MSGSCLCYLVVDWPIVATDDRVERIGWCDDCWCSSEMRLLSFRVWIKRIIYLKFSADVAN
jgi:hypothetical protein